MHTTRRRSAQAVLAGFLLLGGCGGGNSPDAKAAKSKAADGTKTDPKRIVTDEKAADDEGEGEPVAAWAWSLPKGINVPPRVPDDNPMSKEKVELGHRLFMDKRLSVDGTRSCYSCHQNELGNADGRKTAKGPLGKDLPRNTPTIWNVGLLPAWYWDGRSDSLEAQGLAALKGGNMALGDTVEAKAAEIGALPEYADAFAKVFGLAKAAKVTGLHIAQALSAYERTLLCGDTAHDKETQSEAAKRGFLLFASPAGGCITCHAQDNFTDGLYHRMGIGAGDPATPGIDLGRGKITGKPEDNFLFRTPTLRNVAKTAPYFHDGSVATLEEAVKIMASGGITTAGPVDSNLVDRKLSPDQIADLVAFLQSLDCPGTLEVIGDQKVEGITK